MTEFRIVVDIDAPPDRVWGVMRNIERWPDWTPTVTSVRRLNEKSFVIKQPKLLPAKWTLVEMDEPGRNFTWITRGPGMILHARHRVDAVGGRSRVTLSIEFSGMLGPLFARMTAKLNDRYPALEANGLKQRCEGAQTAAS